MYFIAPCLHIVRSKFILKSCFSHALLNTYVSCSTKHGELTWQLYTICRIENMFEQQKALIFISNQSQTESEKNDTDDEQSIDQEVMDEDQRKLKISRTFQKTWLRDCTWSRYEKEAMFCYFCWKSRKTNPFAPAEG